MLKDFPLVINMKYDADEDELSVDDFTLPTEVIEAGKSVMVGRLLCQVAVDLVEGRCTFNEEQ